MERQGFATLDLIASSGIGGLLGDEQLQYWAERDEWEELIDLLAETAKDPSILGMSSHLLYIGRKL